ncbi:MAG: CRISPR-associated endonuclease Cas2 [Planctomycetaceae bacterium]|nr:CRISPR-associated endonuclease Cas2 [Planctomycetaceae bacterium]
MFLTVAYDCTNNKRRNRVAKILLDYGYRVQYSVFEMELDERRSKEMQDRLLEVIDASEDSIRIYRICERCLGQTRIHGIRGLTNQERLFII